MVVVGFGTIRPFNFEILSHEAIANQSEKVGLSPIQQPPYSRVPLKGRNF